MAFEADRLEHRRGEVLGQLGKREALSTAAMYAALMLLPAMFFAGFFNRFSGLRSGGGEYGGGMAYLSGLLPYRDYFTAAPPLNLFKSAILLKLFGRALIVSRSAGVVERLLIGCVLFRWLRQMFRPSHALLASVVTVILSVGDAADPIASYNHDAIFGAMLCGFAASFILARDDMPWSRFAVASVLSGAFGGLSLMSKQTVGLGAMAATSFVVAFAVFRLDGWRRSAAWCALFLLGAAAPIAAVLLYLHRLNVFQDFVRMLFVQGPAAKASHASDFLVRELVVVKFNFGRFLLGMAALVLSWRTLRRSVAAGLPDHEESAAQLRRTALLATIGCVIVGAAQLLSLTSVPALHDFSKCCVYFVFIGLTLLLPGFAFNAFEPEMSRYRAQCALFCAVSWSVAFMLSLSWPAYEAMLLPGLGFLLAAILRGAQPRSLRYIYAAVALIVFLQVREKMDVPFAFDYQTDAPVKLAVYQSVQPQLRWMRFSKPTVAFLDDTVGLAQTHAVGGDTIFTYPEMGLLYSLTGKRFPTFAGSHNIDVINDSFACEEAERLKRAPPSVIVYAPVSEEQLRGAETIWRGGKPSGQRCLTSAVEAIVSGYRIAGRYQLALGNPEITVYVRP
jgi:hypothetical protein